MSKDIRTQRILRIDRLHNSVNGNPAWEITFTDGERARTASDAACSYGIGNPDMREGCLVVVEYTRAGRISRLGPAIDVSEEL